MLTWDGKGMFGMGGKAYPSGSWQVRVRGVRTSANPGGTLKWTVDFEMEGPAVVDFLPKVEEIKLVLAARRLCDAEGNFKDQDGYFTSTYLTPSGLPVEGFQYLIANSHIGGPYKTPLDFMEDIPLSSIHRSGRRMSFSLPVEVPLANDFPAGLFRVEMAFYASAMGSWISLPVLGALDESNNNKCDPDYEKGYYYVKTLLPPISVGKFKAPRMIWTLFTYARSNGVSGVVAKEDAPFFAMSNRIKLQTRYILPCTPDRQECAFNITPDLPTVGVHRMELFNSKEYSYDVLDLDYSKGEVSATVMRPDGHTDNLGTHVFHGRWRYGPWAAPGSMKYKFDQFGRYEIRMTGAMYDRFGNRYEAGGTYEVWVAYPLTFATGIKPGTPMEVGKSYPVAATINPPFPADVTATVRFFPGTHPKDEVRDVYSGKAQRFGYFYPDPSQKPLAFPEQGEYLVDLFATYTDKDGRVYMGNAKNASVVMSGDGNMDIVGAHHEYEPGRVGSLRAFDEFYSRNSNVMFPHDSGSVFRFAGNSLADEMITPTVSVDEPSGELQRLIDGLFPPGLVRLHSKPDKVRAASTSGSLFPGSQEAMRFYGKGYGTGRYLPLMSATSAGYSPFEYPELADRRGYFYIATSRPGFPVYFVVATSAINENYWMVASDYAGTIGAAKRGDQPGDILWGVVSGLFADSETGKEFYGKYSAAGVALPRGDPAVLEPKAARPIARINGVDIGIFAGVGPSPGTIYETGAVKGVGSITVPMAPHDVAITVNKPDGSVLECRGRADKIGNFFCPGGPLVFDRPGVYRVHAQFQNGQTTGTVPGARAGWYQTYAGEKESPYRVLFDRAMSKPVSFKEPLLVNGKVDPPMKSGRAYYSIVAPGILIDEGCVDLDESRFQIRLMPDQIGAEFTNLHDHPGIYPSKMGGYPEPIIPVTKATMLSGNKQRILSDTIEVTVFVEGADREGNNSTAGGKFILRGDRVLIPTQFLNSERESRP